MFSMSNPHSMPILTKVPIGQMAPDRNSSRNCYVSRVMVSDFIEKVGGFLQHQGNKTRLLLERQSEGYFTNNMLVKQVDRAIDIFIFDHAPSHMKRPEDALNAERMNVRNGGKRPFMKDMCGMDVYSGWLLMKVCKKG